MGKIYYIIVAFAALLFTACQEEDFGSETKGGIRISLAEEVGMDISTRSTPKELGKPLASNFKFRITDSEGHKEDHNYTDDVIPLSAGKYEVVAYCGSSATTIALDAPYYEGTAEATVEEGKTTNITLACKVANALLSIRINEDDKEKFNAAFPESYFKLSLESGDNKVSSDTTKSFYFPAGSTITKLAFSKDDSDYQDLGIKNWPPSIKAADHIIVTVGIEPAPSGVSLAVEKIDVQEVPISETIPLEWLPKPKVEADGFTNNALTFVETETPNAKLNLDLASALQDIKFKFDFEDEQFASLENDKEYLLSTDKAAIESALDITLPAIGATEASIDFSGLIAKLRSKENGATSNKIMIVPKANDRWSSEKTDVDSVYTFTCNKPEFSIAVQEGNVWTKTFTIDEPTVTAGDAEVLKKKLVYQYKEKDADDNAWQKCSGDLEHIFSEAPSNKDYQVRAFYREGIVSDVVDVILETPTQVPNANMDAWTSSIKEVKYGLSTYDQPFFEPWEGAVDHWWDTNNHASMPGTLPSIGNASFKCFPTTTFKEPGNGGSGKAAVIRTVNADGFFSTSGSASGDNIRGILYVGTTSNDGTMNEGRAWESRPTKMTFVYAYDSYNNERFGAYIEIYSDETLIGSGKYESINNVSIQDFTSLENPIEIKYTDETLKATSIRIRFCSVAEGDDVNVNAGTYVNVPEGSENNYTIHGGSVLRIDDIQLIYDK